MIDVIPFYFAVLLSYIPFIGIWIRIGKYRFAAGGNWTGNNLGKNEKDQPVG
jgi:hypothetical protein